MDIAVPPHVPPGRPAKRVLVPREHGAYGQLLFPTATALALGDRAASAFALAVVCAAAFAAHEGLLVWLGHRGQRAVRESGRTAVAWLVGCGIVAAAAGTFAIGRLTTPARASLFIPAGLFLVMLSFILRGREHSAVGEIVAAVTLSSCAVPIALAGGVAAARAAMCWMVFALAFIVATVAVQSVIARVKDPHRAASVPLARGRAAWWAIAAMALSAVTALVGALPWAVPVALLPVCAVAGILSLFPPHPRHLRSVGWSFVTATAATALVLTVAFM